MGSFHVLPVVDQVRQSGGAESIPLRPLCPEIHDARYGDIALVGYGVTGLGAWYHALWIIALGLCIILFAWFNGIILGPPAK